MKKPNLSRGQAVQYFNELLHQLRFPKIPIKEQGFVA